MAKPSNIFRWATDALATLAPSSGRQDTGWAADEMPPARVFNWLLNGAYQWQQYLDNLPNEPGFLGAAFSWAAAHTFGGAVNLDGQATVGGSNNLHLAGAGNEVVYTTPRLRGVAVPLNPQGAYLADWARHANGGLVTNNEGQAYEVDLSVPHGATLTAVAARVVGGPGGSNPGDFFRLSLVRVTWDIFGAGPSVSAGITGPGAGPVEAGGLVYADAPVGTPQVLSVGTIAESASANTTFRVRLSAPLGGTPTGSRIDGIYIQYTETRASGHF